MSTWLATKFELGGLWLSFWLARILLYRRRHTHAWYREGKWVIPFDNWCKHATIELRQIGVTFLVTLICIILVSIKLCLQLAA